MKQSTAFSLRSIGGTAGANFAIVAFVTVNGIITARALGPAGRGALLAGVTYVGVCSGLLCGFLQPALARRSAALHDGDAGARARLAGLALWSGIAVSALAVLPSLALILAFLPSADPVFRRKTLCFACVSIPAGTLAVNLLSLDLGRASWTRYNSVRFLQYPVVTAGLVSLLVCGIATPGNVLWVYAAATVSVLTVRGLLVLQEGGIEAPRLRELWAFYREALPYLPLSASSALDHNVEPLVAATGLPLASAGLYAVAQRAPASITPFSQAIGVVTFADAAAGASPSRNPGLTDAAASVRLAARRRRTVLGMLALAVLAVPVVWFGIPLVFGEAFRAARGVGLVLLFAAVFTAVCRIDEQHLSGRGRPLRTLPARGASLALIAGLGILGTRWFGLYGLAAAVLVAQVVRYSLLGRTLAATEGVSFAVLTVPRAADLAFLRLRGVALAARVGSSFRALLRGAWVRPRVQEP